MCTYSKLILNPKYKPNKKNRYNPPRLKDERVKYVPIGCKECRECRRQKAREWQTRLTEDIKENKNGKFITLTFSNDAIKKYANTEKMIDINGYDLDNQIATKAVRLFLERWRKKYGKSLRHWLVTEIGHNGTENIHMHGIIWTNESMKTVEQIWNTGEIKNGFVWKGQEHKGKLINYVSERTVNYMTKYVTKKDLEHQNYNAIILTSPGIGANYTRGQDYKINKYNGTKTKETYLNRS